MPFLQFIDDLFFVSKIESASVALLNQTIDAWQTHCNHHPACQFRVGEFNVPAQVLSFPAGEGKVDGIEAAAD
jgi:hypothetical protein